MSIKYRHHPWTFYRKDQFLTIFPRYKFHFLSHILQNKIYNPHWIYHRFCKGDLLICMYDQVARLINSHIPDILPFIISYNIVWSQIWGLGHTLISLFRTHHNKGHIFIFFHQIFYRMRAFTCTFLFYQSRTHMST